MFIEDGSSICYSGKTEVPGNYSWGWLGDSVPPYACGWTDEDEKAKVLAILKKLDANGSPHVSCLMRGMNSCGICQLDPVKYQGCSGHSCGEIHIEHGGTIFRTPQGVSHYIEVHDYCPPPEAVEAVLNGHPLTRKEVGF
jgi:hypothetical protein